MARRVGGENAYGDPLFAVDHLGREPNIERAQRRHLLLGETAAAADHIEFGSEIAGQRGPGGAGLVNGKLADGGLGVVDAERRAQLFAALALPCELEFVVGHGGTEAIGLVVFAKVAVPGLRGCAECEQQENRRLRRRTG